MPAQFRQQTATHVGVHTLRKSATLMASSHSKGHPPASKFWHRGFGTVKVDGHQVVPFLEQGTAERIAALAAADTGQPMKVIAVDDYWAYMEEE
jgi:hypothetical protein